MGSADTEKYCLKWNDFTTNLSSAFNELRDDEDFFDVTLLTEESEIRCHKLILGACSPHFRTIIKRLANIQNPAIYLRGVRHEDIKNILEFMYLGEVSVTQQDLDSFLSVAQDLCIKGLSQNDKNDASQSKNHQTPASSSQQQHRFKRELTPSASTSNSFSNQGPTPAKKSRQIAAGVASKNGNDIISAASPSALPMNPVIAQVKRESKPEEIHEEIEVLDDDDDDGDPGQLEEFEDYYEAGPSGSGANPGEDGGLEDDSQGFDEDRFAANYNFQIPTDDLEAEEGIVPLTEEGAENSGKMQCLKCFMTFSHLSSAKRHYRNRHLNSETVTCKFCKRILKNKDSLSEHVRTIHGISKKQLKNRIVPNL